MPAAIVRKFEQMVRVSNGAKGPPTAGGPSGPTDMEKVNWLYNVLTILDNKARALLTFDGLLFAGSSAMYDKMTVGWLKYASEAMIVIALVAASLCLFVAVVSYPFLGEVNLGTYDNTREIEALGEAVEKRTSRLRNAWRVSVGVVWALIAVVILRSVL
jgi:hypothetical protein